MTERLIHHDFSYKREHEPDIWREIAVILNKIEDTANLRIQYNRKKTPWALTAREPSNNRLAGCAIVYGNKELSWLTLFVALEFQRIGIGTRLTREAIDICRGFEIQQLAASVDWGSASYRILTKNHFERWELADSLLRIDKIHMKLDLTTDE